MPAIPLSELLELIDEPIEVLNRREILVAGVRNLADAGPGEITFAKGDRKALLSECRADVVITSEPEDSLRGLELFDDVVWVLTDKPRLAIARIAAAFEAPLVAAASHGTAHIEGTARVGTGVVVGPAATIGADVSVGDQVTIGPGAHLMRGVRIGKGSTVGPGAVIGFQGFGYERTEKEWIRLPHLGSVVVGDRVEIGANVCIDRGTFGDTVIGEGVKIDNLTHIAHNVKVGANTVIAAKCVVAGSVVIGEDVWLGPGSSVLNGVEIGDEVFVGIGSAVIRDIARGGRVGGVPARPIPG